MSLCEDASAVDSEERRADLAMALECGGDEARSAVAEIQGCLYALAFDPEGCSLVQRALEVASQEEQRGLAEALRGAVCEAARSPYAHQVLESVIGCLGAEGGAFVAGELLLQGGGEVSSNAHMCSVLCHLLECAPMVPSTVALVDEVLSDDAADLCCRKFGHLVAMAIVKHCIMRQAAVIVGALRTNPQRFARHRFASKVFEGALRSCCAELSGALAHDLMEQPGAVASMACHNFGVHVVRALLEVPKPLGYARQARQYLCRASKRVCKDKYGFELMRELGLAPLVVAARDGHIGGA